MHYLCGFMGQVIPLTKETGLCWGVGDLYSLPGGIEQRHAMAP